MNTFCVCLCASEWRKKGDRETKASESLSYPIFGYVFRHNSSEKMKYIYSIVNLFVLSISHITNIFSNHLISVRQCEQFFSGDSCSAAVFFTHLAPRTSWNSISNEQLRRHNSFDFRGFFMGFCFIAIGVCSCACMWYFLFFDCKYHVFDGK